MPKSILIDATHFQNSKPTGVELYVDALLPLLSQKLLKSEWKVTWVAHQALNNLPVGVEMLISPHKPLWGQRTVAQILAQRKPSIFFTPSGIPPLFIPIPTALTVHDISFYTYPEDYSLSSYIRLAHGMSRSARNACVLFTPSQFVKEQVKARWHLSDEKIKVTPLAATETMVASEVVELPSQTFVLYVGRIELKKNLAPLFYALAEVPDLYLVCAGREGYGFTQVKKLLNTFPEEVQKRVIFPGYISPGQKKWLYEHARATVVPGMAEGFGIPVLEGFSLDCPVIAAAAGSLPEVSGSAALLVQGEDVEEWRRGLVLMKDENVRADLIARGQKRAEDFSWERTAEQTALGLVRVS